MLHYDAILFDVDGTLIDSAPGILHTLKRSFRKMGVTSPASICAAIWARCWRKSFASTSTELDKIEQATRLYRKSLRGEGAYHECAVAPR